MLGERLRGFVERVSGASGRRFVRIKPAPGQAVRVQLMGDGYLESARARDLSMGGIAMYIPHGMSRDAFGGKVQLIVTLPGTRPFSVGGIVRHAAREEDERFIGVEFGDMADEARRLLEAYVTKRIQEGGTI